MTTTPTVRRIEPTGPFPGVTLTDRGTVTLGGRVFAVEEQHIDGATYGPTIRLIGPNGGQFFLRGYLGPDTGARQVISWKSGQPLRIRGNEVRVVMVAGVIEQYVAPVGGARR